MRTNDLFGDIEVIDSHVHIHGWENSKGENFIHGYDEYIGEFGFRSINIAALPSAYRDVSNNIIAAFYKLTDPKVYAHGGLIYNTDPRDCEGMDPVLQYNELMDIGFDGIKMLEGKPSVYVYHNIPLCDDFYDDFFAECEKNNTHILMHVNDPEEFWDPKYATEENIKKGWFYGDSRYIRNKDMYDQIYKLLENHPKLSLTLAHFFFMSKTPERLEELFEKYENLAVDITPGGEMFIAFNERYDYFRKFFTKYSSRILFGTDSDFPTHMPAMEWLADRLFKYVATDIATDAWPKEPLRGLNLDKKDAQNIMGANFVRRVSEKPKAINKIALKNYIEKYKRFIKNEGIAKKVDAMSEKLL